MPVDLRDMLGAFARRGIDRVVVAVVGPLREVSLVAGASAKGPLAPEDLEDLSRTVLERAIEHHRTASTDTLDEPSESVSELRILRAMATPIGADGTLVLYADARRPSALAHLDEEALEALAAEIDAQATRSPGAQLEAVLLLPGLARLAGPLRAWVRSKVPLLVLGEPGVGKTHLAMALAQALERRPVVRATLGSSADLNTITSELFGHERGAFSGAVQRRAGLVEQADGGVLVLDEILSFPVAAQALLLDFVQFGTYRPLGHSAREARRADVRLVGVTNGDLGRAVKQGEFRKDLADRWMGFVVEVPPLRERPADVVALASRFLEQSDPGAHWKFSLELRQKLSRGELAWPGNVRQLELAVQRARARVLVEEGAEDRRTIETRHFFDAGVAASEVEVRGPRAGIDAPEPRTTHPLSERWSAMMARREELEALERQLIEEALAKWGGVVARAARELGAKRTSLISRIEKLGARGPR